MQRFRASGDVRDLWPGVTRNDLAIARGEIERAVRALLRPAAGAATTLRTAPPDARVASIAAFSMGVGPLLGFWIETDRLDASGPLRALLLEQLDHNRRFIAKVERGLTPVLRALGDAGITPTAIKGLHTGRAYWSDAGARPIADADLLVPPQHLAETERILTQHGFVAKDRTISVAYKRDWVPPGISATPQSIERPDADNPWQIDLHVSLNQEFSHGACAELDRIVGRSELTLGGSTVHAPCQPLTLLLLATHAARDLNSMRLLRLVEIIQVIRADVRAHVLDWSVVLDAMRATGSSRYAFPALHLAEELAPGTVDAEVIAHCRKATSWGVRHTVSHMVPSGSSIDHKSVVSEFMWASSPWDLARRVAARILARDSRTPVQRWTRLFGHMVSGRIGVRPPEERRPSSPTS